MAKESSSKSVRLNLRFDEELREQIERAAQQSLRSMNSEAVYRIKRTFERQPDEAAA
jgi:uncharacterized protein (DUF1778 family)